MEFSFQWDPYVVLILIKKKKDKMTVLFYFRTGWLFRVWKTNNWTRERRKNLEGGHPSLIIAISFIGLCNY